VQLQTIASKINAVGISVDTPEDSQKLRAKLKLTFPLLSDPDLKTIDAYGVRMTDSDIAVPATFIVTKDATIAYRYIGETQADRPTNEELLKALASLPSGQ